MTILLGIDIGLTGSVARLGPGLGPALADIPTVPDGEPRPGRGNSMFQPRRIDGRQLLDLLRSLCPAGHAVMAVMEDVKARPMGNSERHFNSFHSQNSLVLSRGVIQAVLDIAGFEVQVVQPQTWKKFFGLNGADKTDSLDMARRLFPDLAHELRLKKFHNRAEGLLMAHYGLRKLT